MGVAFYSIHMPLASRFAYLLSLAPLPFQGHVPPIGLGFLGGAQCWNVPGVVKLHTFTTTPRMSLRASYVTTSSNSRHTRRNNESYLRRAGLTSVRLALRLLIHKVAPIIFLPYIAMSFSYIRVLLLCWPSAVCSMEDALSHHTLSCFLVRMSEC